MFKGGCKAIARVSALLALAAALAAGLALAQDKTMLLGGDALKPMSRPRVKFNHDWHSQKLACFQCHHDYDQNWKNLYEEGMANACADCHSVSPGPKDNPLPLARAYHRQCKSCHRELAAKGNPKAPLTCGGCHVRGK